jgi:hypothetical protein
MYLKVHYFSPRKAVMGDRGNNEINMYLMATVIKTTRLAQLPNQAS